jgi:non-ribosomal peptide synthetase component F
LLLQVRETTLDAFSHEDMPLERLGLRPPVLRAFFSFQDARGRPLSLGEIPVTQIHVEPPTAANDMMFWVMETRAGLTAVINYSAELFEHASIERFLRGFGALLRAILVNPSALVGELPIAEPADLAVARSFGEPLGQLGPTLLQSIVTRAERQPEAAALVHGETRLTYAELLARSAGVAQLLAATGLGAGKHVAVFARNPLQRLAGVLGVLRAGAAFSVLDPQLPTARLRKLCDALTPDALLFAQGSEPPAGLAPQRLQFDDQTTAEPGATEFATASPTSAACVVAEFDGEGIAHASTVSLAGLSAGCAAVARALALDEHSTLALLPAAWSNVALLAALAPLAVGARSVWTQPQRWAALGPRLTVFGPAAAWWRCSAADLTGVERALIVDEVAPELAERLLHAGVQPFRLHAYAEAGLAPFVQSIDHPAQGGWLGQPQFPTRCAILDDTGVALPIGTLGPLYVRSAFAHAGAQPVGPAARGGWYATGEYARFNYQAELVPAPRVDGITTLNGERVALSEVSSALLCHPSIERAGLALKPGKTRAPQLIAYIVVRRDAAYTETELRRRLREHLPEALIPQLFVEVDQLLLNAAGGLDTTRMPAPPGADEGDYVAPRTAAERLLAQLWSDALEMPRVSLYDNFFDLGGQSLLCFQVIGQLEQATGRRISPRSLLLGTLEQVAAELPVQVCEEPSVPNAAAIAPVSPARPTQSKPATTLFKLLRGILGA